MISTTISTPSSRLPASRSRPCEPEPDVCCEPGRAPAALCRPRFFAGQLLTETDLNRLDAYIRGKNRLHTLHLHGWGVVGGLEVRCDPCDCGTVSVSPGYAISPCGDDVVVPAMDAVDVCGLIREVQRAECEAVRCEPLRKVPRYEGCDEDACDWILAICYDEEPTRGVTALRHSGDGCGCAEPTVSPARPSRVACEPTVICEGYRYVVYRAPAEARPSRGRLVERLLCCAQPYLDMTLLLREQRDLGESLRAFRRALRARYVADPGTFCGLLARLDAIVIADDSTWERAAQELIVLWVLGLIECICSVLLPPGPEPVDGECIPLARITVASPERDDERRVRRGVCVEEPCCVERVCNWTPERKIAFTPAALGYWLSPLGPVVRGLIEAACCELPQRLRGRLPERDPQTGAQPIGETTAPPPSAVRDAGEMPPAHSAGMHRSIEGSKQKSAGMDLRTASRRVAAQALSNQITPESATLLYRLAGARYAASGRRASEMLDDLLVPLALDRMPESVTMSMTGGMFAPEPFYATASATPEASVADIEAQIDALRRRLDTEMERAKALRTDPDAP